MEDFDIPAVEAAMSRLREIQAEVFGADGHGFQMNPALPESEVALFGRDHKIELPSDYRQFLTTATIPFRPACSAEGGPCDDRRGLHDQ
jgi:hypothetical protein